MKISKLLVLSALWLCGLGAQAAIVDGVRQAPEPATTPFQTSTADEVFYLYNTSAKMFFTQGNTWGTRACVGPYASAVKVYFSEAPDGGYLINNYICIRSTSYSWKNACAEAEGSALYCDQSASWGRPYWKVVPTSGNGFRLQTTNAIEVNEEGLELYMGRDEAVGQDFYNAYAGFADDSQRFPVSDNVAEGEGHYVDWALVSSTDYEAMADVYAVYAKAQELKAAIDEAKSKGLDVSAQEAVYLNEAATLEELEAALTAVKEAIANQAENQASVAHPVDMTSSIANPNFDGASNTGWSGTAPNMTGDGNHGAADVAEQYNKTFDTYQALTDLPKGVYKMNAKTFFRGTYDDLLTGANKVAYMYAATGDTLRTWFTNAYAPLNTESFVEKYGATTYFGTPNVESSTATADGITYYIPNNPSTFRLYYEEEGKDYYDTNLFFAVTDGKVNLGVKKDRNVTGTDWAVFDQFNLTYYGNATEAYQYWLDEYKKQCEDYSDMDESIVVTEAYVEAYNQALANANAANREEVVAAIADIEAAAADIALNIDLWKQYQALVAKAMETISNGDLDQDRIDMEYAVEDWAEFDAEDAINAREMTNEELQAEITKWTAILEEVKTWFKPVEGDRVDMTKMLTNPDFTGNADGWTRQAESGGNVAWGSNCYEAWNNASFDVYQVVKNAPEGVYEIEVQGFYRYGRNNAWADYNAQTVSYVKPGGAPVFVYMNAKQTPFQNVFDEPVTEAGFYSTQITTINTEDGETLYFPDGMISGNEAFTAGMYKQSAYGIIRAGQDMRIGVKGVSNQLGDSWVIWDNFKLYNVGKNVDVMQNILSEEIANAKTLADNNMGKTIYENLAAAIATAETALSNKDGDAMFEALFGLFDAEENVNASIALFKELYDANEDLLDVIGRYDDSPYKAEAGNLYETIDVAITSHEIEDADVKDYLIQIKTMKTKLRLPDYADASDLNPIEVSSVIENATYDEGLKGWDGTTAAHKATAGNAEIFNSNYDYYQDIYGLPAGTYQLQLQGFYRAGGFAADYAAYKANPDSLNYAFYYGMILNEGDTIYSSKTLKRLAAEAVSTEVLEADWVWASEADQMAVPNTMVAAGDAFMNELYYNEPLTVKVGEDGYLRIGLKKDVNIDTNWTIFDNWQLTYFGTESELTVDGDKMQGIADVNVNAPVRIEFFTLDGRKATGSRSGIVIMKQTMGNGAVVVRKIRK